MDMILSFLGIGTPACFKNQPAPAKPAPHAWAMPDDAARSLKYDRGNEKMEWYARSPEHQAQFIADTPQLKTYVERCFGLLSMCLVAGRDYLDLCDQLEGDKSGCSMHLLPQLAKAKPKSQKLVEQMNAYVVDAWNLTVGHLHELEDRWGSESVRQHVDHMKQAYASGDDLLRNPFMSKRETHEGHCAFRLRQLECLRSVLSLLYPAP